MWNYNNWLTFNQFVYLKCQSLSFLHYKKIKNPFKKKFAGFSSFFLLHCWSEFASAGRARQALTSIVTTLVITSAEFQDQIQYINLCWEYSVLSNELHLQHFVFKIILQNVLYPNREENSHLDITKYYKTILLKLWNWDCFYK